MYKSFTKRQSPDTAYLGAMFNHRHQIAMIALLLVASACRKQGDEDPPKVRILLPVENITLQVPDTLIVQVQVQDEHKVERITISLNDSNGAPVIPAVSVSVNSTNTTISRGLPITSERLRTGNYTLTVSASDGTNMGRGFRSVNLQAAPLRLRAIYVTPPNGQSPSAPIWRIDSTGALSQYLNLTEFGGAAIDADRLYIAGTTVEPLRGIPQTATSTSITIPNQSAAGSTVPFFLGPTVDPSDGGFYFGSDDGFIRGYKPGGSQFFTGQSPAEMISQQTALVGNVLVSVAKQRVMGTWHLVAHAIPGGSPLAQFQLDLVPITIYAISAQQALIFGNRGTIGVVQLRNPAQGGNTDLSIFNDGPVQAVAQLNSGTYIIALSDRLVRFSTSSNTITVVAQGISAQCLAFDQASGILHIGVDNALLAMDPLTGATNTLHSFPHRVGSILPLLNR